MKKPSLVVVCHGNIMRSQVLEQYLRHYATLEGLPLDLYSFGIAHKDSYRDDNRLLDEVRLELTNRGIKHTVARHLWNETSRSKIDGADYVLVADDLVRSELFRLAGHAALDHKVMSFYAFIGEDDKDFPDTFDRKTKRQQPVWFLAAFDELDRIARKIVHQRFLPSGSTG